MRLVGLIALRTDAVRLVALPQLDHVRRIRHPLASRHRVDVVLPQSSFDLQALSETREQFPVPVLVASPETVLTSSRSSTGTPATAIRRFDSIFEPITSIASGGGPIQTRSCSAHARANCAFSARKP